MLICTMVMLPLAQILSGLKCSQAAAATKTGLFIVPALDLNPRVKQISKSQSGAIIFPPPSLSNCHLHFRTRRACVCVCVQKQLPSPVQPKICTKWLHTLTWLNDVWSGATPNLHHPLICCASSPLHQPNHTRIPFPRAVFWKQRLWR